MMQRTLELYYDQLVIGSDLNALSYCINNNCPSIYLRVLYPYKYNEKEDWKILRHEWQQKAYTLSYNGFPLSNKLVSLRLEDDKVIKGVTKLGLVITIKYNKLLISDDYKIEGLPPTQNKTNYDNWVIDWFDVLIGAKHDLECISDSDDFIRKIYFYPSTRGFKINLYKDIAAVSKITDEKLNDFDYSETVARLKILKMLDSSGIKGNWDKTNERFTKPKLISTRRDIYPLGKNIYSNLPKSIEILYD